MMNVNFFVKKKRNILPYIVGGVFILFLLLMALYFYFTYNNYQDQITEQNNWLDENTEKVVLARRIRQVDESATQAVTVQETLRDNQYPMNELSEELAAAVPSEEERITSFTITQPTQLNLTVENINVDEAQSIVENFEALPYVRGVQFLRADKQDIEEEDHRFELIIDLDPNHFPKEVAE